MNTKESFQAVKHAMETRKTIKVLSKKPWPVQEHSDEVKELLECAHWAPFHKAASKKHTEDHDLKSVVPWRFYALDAKDCRELRKIFIKDGDDGKLPMMLATADAMAVATWLPNPGGKKDQLFEPTLENMEHIAAASSAVQNFLIAATAKGIPNYWSSGGALRKPKSFKLLGIPKKEILLGALFLFPEDHKQAETSTSKLRSKRGPVKSWSTFVELDS